MSGSAGFNEAERRRRSISGVRLAVAPAFSAELPRGSGDKGSPLVAVTPGIGFTRYEGSRRASPRDSRRAIASCGSRHGTRFHSPQRGCAIPVSGRAVSAFLFGVSHEKRTFSRRSRPRTRAPARDQEGYGRAFVTHALSHQRARRLLGRHRRANRCADLRHHRTGAAPVGRQAEDSVRLLRAHAHRATASCSIATSTPGCRKATPTSA